MSPYQKALSNHYCKVWQSEPVIRKWRAGPMSEVNEEFCVLEFSPYSEREMWTYATSGMSPSSSETPIEVHLFSAVEDYSLVELLTVIAHYHSTGAELDVGHTVNFGRPWQGQSNCSYGLLSIPYLDGPELENMAGYQTKCYWLIPVTKQERNFKIEFGLEELEDLFEASGLDYLDPNRTSVV